LLQKGHIYFDLAQAGDIPALYRNALGSYSQVIEAFDSHLYHNPFVVSDAFYHAGLVMEALGQPGAEELYTRVLELPGAAEDIVALAQDKLNKE
jgi:hypothetical protein